MKLIKHKKYEVLWIDAESDSSWYNEKDIDEALIKSAKGVTTLGFFIKEDKNFLVFTSGMANSGDIERLYFDYQFIPKKTVLNIKQIKN